MADIEGMDKFTQHFLTKGLLEEDLDFIDFANDALGDFMRQEPSKFVSLGKVHDEWWDMVDSGDK